MKKVEKEYENLPNDKAELLDILKLLSNEKDECQRFLSSVKRSKKPNVNSSAEVPDIFLMISTKHDIKQLNKKEELVIEKLFSSLSVDELCQIGRISTEYGIDPVKAAEYFFFYGDCENLGAIIYLDRPYKRTRH